MTGNADIPELERSTFFNGQRLTAGDLTDLHRTHRELRWLHNRALHGWGIAVGLAVTGERGDTVITIEPGYGVDCQGREIILTESRAFTVPAVAGGPGGAEAVYYLVAAFQPDDEQKIAERRPGVCLPEGTVRLSEEPLIEWQKPEKLLEGHELVLAQAWIQNCQLSRPLSLAPRRYARPADQPYIAAGQTEEPTSNDQSENGKSRWDEWNQDNELLGVMIEVDTTSARFRSTPYYMAHVVGDRHFIDDSEQFHVITGIVTIGNATPEGFVLWMRIDIEQIGLAVEELLTQINENLKLRVNWMGNEG